LFQVSGSKCDGSCIGDSRQLCLFRSSFKRRSEGNLDFSVRKLRIRAHVSQANSIDGSQTLKPIVWTSLQQRARNLHVFHRRIENSPPTLDFRYEEVKGYRGTVVAKLDYMSSQLSEKALDLGC
jgi:hypothetical protein